MNNAVPSDIEVLRTALVAAEARAEEAEAKATRAEAEASSAEAIIATLKLEIEKLRREIYGQRSERKARLLDQLELQLEELEAHASEDELAGLGVSPEAFRLRPHSSRPIGRGHACGSGALAEKFYKPVGLCAACATGRDRRWKHPGNPPPLGLSGVRP